MLLRRRGMALTTVGCAVAAGRSVFRSASALAAPHLTLSIRVHTVNKADIVDRIAAGTGLTKIETEAVVNGFIQCVIDAMKEGRSIELRGFGTFKIQHRAPRTARNPRTNEELQIPARHVPVFKPSKDFRLEVERELKSVR